MKTRQRDSHSTIVKSFSFFVAVLALLILPCNVFADSQVLLRIVDSIDLVKLSEELKDLKLSAAIKTNKDGDVVVRCFNSFSLPIAHHAFDGNPDLQKLMQRTTLQMEQKGNGVMVKLAFLF